MTFKHLLPPRLREHLSLKVEGLSDAEIAERLTVSVQTVRTYTKRLRTYFADEIGAEEQDRNFNPQASLIVSGLRYFEHEARLIDLRTDNEVSSLKDKLNLLHEQSATPYQYGNRVIVLANEFAAASLWAEAICAFHEVENILGRGSSQSARAAIEAALLYIQLGDYDGTLMEIDRIESSYSSQMDLVTEARFCELRGWLAGYYHEFSQGERCFQRAIAISREIGMSYIGETAQHCIGTLYYRWGRSVSDRKMQETLFHKGAAELDKAYDLHRMWPDTSRGFDKIRKAELLRVQGNWAEANQLRNEARSLFGTELATAHVDIEEAKISLLKNQTQEVQRYAGRALEIWSQLHFPEGIAEALRVLGSLRHKQGKTREALELYITALCVFPVMPNLHNRQTWRTVHSITKDLSRRSNQNLIRHIQKAAEAGEGYFGYLGDVSPDRSNDLSRILSKLTSEN